MEITRVGFGAWQPLGDPLCGELQRVIDQVTNGGGGMPPFKGTLTDQQIQDVAAYVTTKVAK